MRATLVALTAFGLLALTACGDGSQVEAAKAVDEAQAGRRAPLKGDLQASTPTPTVTPAASPTPVATVAVTATEAPSPTPVPTVAPTAVPTPFERYSMVCVASYEGRPDPALPFYKATVTAQLDFLDPDPGKSIQRTVSVAYSHPEVRPDVTTRTWDENGVIQGSPLSVPVGANFHVDGTTWLFDGRPGGIVLPATECTRTATPPFPTYTF